MTAKIYDHVKDWPTHDLLVVLRFFDHDRLRQYYSGLIADIKGELLARGIDPNDPPAVMTVTDVTSRNKLDTELRSIAESERRCEQCGAATYNNELRCEQCKISNPFRELS
ncbi:MAG TPA: hypothetical protein VFN67_37415 [Polyangiales bacterium]|nr:hypothetical protein [Polyangiales bacterium]